MLMARFDPRLVQYSLAQTQQFYTQLAERIREATGVQSAAFTQNPPLGLDAFDRIAFVPDGYVMPRDRENFTVLADTVDEGFFSTMGVQILAGNPVRSGSRSFRWRRARARARPRRKCSPSRPAAG